MNITIMSQQFDLQLLHEAQLSAEKACRSACFFCMNEIVFDKMITEKEVLLSYGGKLKHSVCSLKSSCELYEYAMELNNNLI